MNLIIRPLPRLIRIELLLRDVMKLSPKGHEDHTSIPPILDIIKEARATSETGMQNAEGKVKLMQYKENLVFGPNDNAVSLLCDSWDGSECFVGYQPSR
jgi:hypothetical protein